MEGNGTSEQVEMAGQFQAGIAALHVLPGKAYSSILRKTPPSPTHALTVRGNTVSTPSGPAVWVLGIGPMAISDNILVSQGEFEQAYDEKLIPVKEIIWDYIQGGSVISVVNIGFGPDDPIQDKQIGLKNILDYMKGLDEQFARTDFVRLPPGAVQCVDNQVHLYREGSDTSDTVEHTIQGAVAVKHFSNTFIVSMDDVRLQGPQLSVAIGSKNVRNWSQHPCSSRGVG